MKTPDHPKQRIAVIHSEPRKEGFLQINRDAWRYAAKVLEKKYSALVVYLELANNADGWEDPFYPATLVKEIGMSEKSWNNGFNTLIEEGFLKHIDGEPSWRFHFKPTPWETEEKMTVTKFMLMSPQEQEAYYDKIYFSEEELSEEDRLILQIVDQNNMIDKWVKNE